MINASIDNLKNITKLIGDALALDIDQTNPDEVIGKIETLSRLLGTSSEACAMANLLYDDKIRQLTESAQFAGFTATDRKNIFNGRAKDEGYYVVLTDRQNKALTHAIDGLRSIISYIKSEVNNLHTQGT